MKQCFGIIIHIHEKPLFLGFRTHVMCRGTLQYCKINGWWSGNSINPEIRRPQDKKDKTVTARQGRKTSAADHNRRRKKQANKQTNKINKQTQHPKVKCLKITFKKKKKHPQESVVTRFWLKSTLSKTKSVLLKNLPKSLFLYRSFKLTQHTNTLTHTHICTQHTRQTYAQTDTCTHEPKYTYFYFIHRNTLCAAIPDQSSFS